jgi:hypothetical protein
MKRARLIVGITACLLLAASLVAWYLQPSPVDVARRHCAGQGFADDNVALLGYQGSGGLFHNKETVRFQLRGAAPAKKLVVELWQPVYFLPWQVADFREEADR